MRPVTRFYLGTHHVGWLERTSVPATWAKYGAGHPARGPKSLWVWRYRAPDCAGSGPGSAEEVRS